MAPTGDPGSAYGGRGVTMMGLLWAEFLLAALLIGARLYTNSKIVGEFGWDFFWAVFALVVGTMSQCFLSVAVHYGIGRHILELSTEQTELAIKWVWVAQSTTIAAIALGKLVVIAFILRVQGTTHRKGTFLLYFLGISNVAINLAECTIVMFQCKPTYRLWKPTVPGSCYIQQHVNPYTGYTQGSWNALTDVILAIYPAFIFFKLQMPLKLKIGVSALMATGLFTALCAIMKTWQIRVVSHTEDVTFALTPLVIWNSSEFWVTLLVGSLPPIWPTVMYFWRKHRGVVSYPTGSKQRAYAGHSDNRISIPLRSRLNRSAKGEQILQSSASNERLRDPNEILKTTNVTIEQTETPGESKKGVDGSPDSAFHPFPEPRQQRHHHRGSS